MRKIRVLVIDDSAYNRRTISKILEELPEIEVVGYATDGEEGIRKVIDLSPDLVTLDLEMPKMDGYTFLRIVMSRCPTPVLVVSSRGDREGVFKAMELGAVDFVLKPAASVSAELVSIAEDLRAKVRTVLSLNMAGIKERTVQSVTVEPPPSGASLATRRANGADVVAIGSSTGGPPALQGILSAFTEVLPLAVVVSQHMPPKFTKAFADRLNRTCAMEVREAKDGDKVRPGRVLIAPGGRNMTFEQVGDEVVVHIPEPQPQDKYVPSVDVMMASCAGVFGRRVLGVILTGMGNDGAKGVREIKKSGGQVIAEAEETAVVFGMPREAIATGTVDSVVRLEKIASEILLRSGLVRGIGDRS